MGDKKLLVLIVEDEPLTALVLQSAINEHGHQSVVASCLAEASAALIKAAIDAAVLDINLPDGASYAIARALRSQHIPFFFATGQYMGDHIGFADVKVVPKPFDRAALMEAIAELDTQVVKDIQPVIPAKSAGTSP